MRLASTPVQEPNMNDTKRYITVIDDAESKATTTAEPISPKEDQEHEISDGKKEEVAMEQEPLVTQEAVGKTVHCPVISYVYWQQQDNADSRKPKYAQSPVSLGMFLFGVAVAIFIVSRLLSRDGTTIAVHVKHYNRLNGLQCHFEIVPGSPVSGSCTQMDGKTEWSGNTAQVLKVDISEYA